MKRKILTLTLMAGLPMAIGATIPSGHYDSLAGKSGETLRRAVSAISQPTHIVSYGGGSVGSWDSFSRTDVRVIEGREAWWDMYSNNIVYLPAYDAMNIEHCVPNSWWGGVKQHDSYKDLFHLNPSDAIANGQKSNLPLGMVMTASYDNGVVKIGTPVAGHGGGSSKVFEPADEYKGDFARAYFYIFTVYEVNTWDSDASTSMMYEFDGTNARLKPWATDLLLEWSRQDPVDDKEIARNEAIYIEQGNRNPFIDMPVLAEYIWGDKKSVALKSSDLVAVEAVNRPAAPAFGDYWLTHVNTYKGRWWDATDVRITSPADATLYVAGENGIFQTMGPHMTISAASGDNGMTTVRAYSEKTVDGLTLRSAVSSLTLLADNPATDDYSDAIWRKVSSQSDIADGAMYVMLSSNTLHVMGVDATAKLKYVPSAGFVRFDADDNINMLPYDAAVVKLHAAAEGKYTLELFDIFGNSKGYYNTTAKNSMSLKSGQGTAAAVKVGEDGGFEADFGSTPGRLQFNKTQPRFCNYTSSQTPVLAYSFVTYTDNRPTSVMVPGTDSPVAVDGNSIYGGENASIYDLNGRRVDGHNLAPGIYIVIRPGHTPEKIQL